jgi:L-Ala-D/L-Glu epimerase
MKLIFHQHTLPLRHTFTIAHDSRKVQETLIVELYDRETGVSGFGEATANPYYGITIASMIAALKTVRAIVETQSWQTAETLWAETQPLLAANSFAQCALDEAAHDFVAKKAGLPLYKFWHLDPAQNPRTNYTIGIDTVENMVAKMQQMPWPIYKIKLGGQANNDLAIVRELRRHTAAMFRVDANCGWTADQTVQFAPVLQTLGVEFIEQPLPANDWDSQRYVFEKSVLPIIADESCIVEADVEKCAGFFHGVNIKLTKCGGLTSARRMIANARQNALRVMVGCMTESSVGISAIAHLLPLLNYVDMDGSLLIANDPATGVTFDFGRVIYAEGNGTGASILTQRHRGH